MGRRGLTSLPLAKAPVMVCMAFLSKASGALDRRSPLRLVILKVLSLGSKIVSMLRKQQSESKSRGKKQFLVNDRNAQYRYYLYIFSRLPEYTINRSLIFAAT